MAEYYQTGSQFQVSGEELRKTDRATQLEVLEHWFRENFEDPAERTPYESAEGGYIWIWGGPYDAREQLEGEFSNLVSEDLIEELAEELDGECPEWAPTPKAEDYDNSLIFDLSQISEYYPNFSSAILDVEALVKVTVDDGLSSAFNRMLFVSVITAMEVYLSDAFINTVLNNKDLMRQFIETTPEFQAQKVPLSGVFSAVEQAEQKARSYLIDVVWHHLHRVKPMYRDTLGVEFPNDMGSLFKSVGLRHDIVHRNGKTKDGREIVVTAQSVSDLIGEVESFVQHVDQQLGSIRKRSSESNSLKPSTVFGRQPHHATDGAARQR